MERDRREYNGSVQPGARLTVRRAVRCEGWGDGVKKGERPSVLTVIIKCEISCTHPIVTIKDGRRTV